MYFKLIINVGYFVDNYNLWCVSINARFAGKKA